VISRPILLDTHFVLWSRATPKVFTPPHCLELVHLPTHHRDPFDRILIAQARTDDLTLLTRDEEILSYGADGARCAEI